MAGYELGKRLPNETSGEVDIEKKEEKVSRSEASSRRKEMS